MNKSNTVVTFGAAITLINAAAVMADRGEDTDFEPRGKSPFSFALIGDTPYGVAPGADASAFDALTNAVNRDRKVRWVMHAGDIKSGSTECSDALLSDRRERFDAFRQPFVLTPGDNEWTDCHRAKAGGYAPLERLAAVRRAFYADPQQTLGGHPMQVESQALQPGYEEFPEHQRWTWDGVIFATLHVVGSHNGLDDFPGRSVADDAEVGRRAQAAIAWLDDTFALAKRQHSAGVFLMMQADPGLERAPVDRTGFEEILAALEAHVRDYGKPVVLAHGDSHYFRIDKPGLHSGDFLANLTRVETFGAGQVHWIKVNVDPKTASVFHFQPMIVDANR